MSEVKWIKINTDMFDNAKIKFIRNLPQGSDLLLIWIMLLVKAGKCNSKGFIFLTENIPYDNETISNEFSIPSNVISLALETFERLKMIEKDEKGFICITGWNEHQNAAKLDEIREYNRIAKQKSREKQNFLPLINVLDKSRQFIDGQDTDIDIDIEVDKESNITEKTILHELKAIKDYPFDYKKDLDYIRTLSVEFPNKNLLETVKSWKVWLLDHPLKKASNPRSQIRNWLKPKKWEKKEDKGLFIPPEPDIPEEKLKYMEMTPVD